MTSEVASNRCQDDSIVTAGSKANSSTWNRLQPSCRMTAIPTAVAATRTVSSRTVNGRQRVVSSQTPKRVFSGVGRTLNSSPSNPIGGLHAGLSGIRMWGLHHPVRKSSTSITATSSALAVLPPQLLADFLELSDQRQLPLVSLGGKCKAKARSWCTVFGRRRACSKKIIHRQSRPERIRRRISAAERPPSASCGRER